MARIQLRRDLSSKWASANPVLGSGEPGFEEDTNKFKIGNGSARWLDLEYFSPGIQTSEGPVGDAVALVQAHINSLTPHPVYDDGPSLLLLYQNAKV